MQAQRNQGLVLYKERDVPEQLRDESQESFDNMPEHLQETSESGMILEERINHLEDVINEIESVEIPEEPENWEDEITDFEELDEEDQQYEIEEWKEGKLEEIRELISSSWPAL